MAIDAYLQIEGIKGESVMNQWKGDVEHKPTVSMRHIGRKGRNKDGSFVDPSNNAEAFSVIER
jgi:type VI protein secretion system component Hcp